MFLPREKERWVFVRPLEFTKNNDIIKGILMKLLS